MYHTYQYVYTATSSPPLISNDQLGGSNSLVVPLCSAQLQMHKLRSRNLPRFRTHPCLCLPLMNLMHSVSAMYVHCTHSLWQHIFFHYILYLAPVWNPDARHHVVYKWFHCKWPGTSAWQAVQFLLWLNFSHWSGCRPTLPENLVHALPFTFLVFLLLHPLLRWTLGFMIVSYSQNLSFWAWDVF